MSETEIAALIEQATSMHKLIVPPMTKLRVDQEHYRALRDLHGALCDSVERITGDRVPWAIGSTTA